MAATQIHQLRNGVSRRTASRTAFGGQNVEMGEFAGVSRKPILTPA